MIITTKNYDHFNKSYRLTGKPNTYEKSSSLAMRLEMYSLSSFIERMPGNKRKLPRAFLTQRG